jgi:hypothetical protein
MWFSALFYFSFIQFKLQKKSLTTLILFIHVLIFLRGGRKKQRRGKTVFLLPYCRDVQDPSHPDGFRLVPTLSHAKRIDKRTAQAITRHWVGWRSGYLRCDLKRNVFIVPYWVFPLATQFWFGKNDTFGPSLALSIWFPEQICEVIIVESIIVSDMFVFNLFNPFWIKFLWFINVFDPSKCGELCKQYLKFYLFSL